jgi:hypothetical protein
MGQAKVEGGGVTEDKAQEARTKVMTKKSSKVKFYYQTKTPP